MTDTDLTARLDVIESRVACERLVYQYAIGFDLHDEDLVMAIWNDGAELLLGDELGNHTGLGAIRRHVLASWVKTPFMHHWMANPIIDIDGDRGTGISSLDCFVQDSDSGPTQVSGIYRDVFERRDGRWGITRRTFELHYWTPQANWRPLAGAEAVQALAMDPG